MHRIGVKAKSAAILATGCLAVFLVAGQALAGAGRSTQIPAFYDGDQVTINIFEVESGATLIAKNKGVNEIYATNDLDEEQDFAPVIDAIQGDGFNPLWHQFLIVFDTIPPQQFTSEEDVEAAADAGQITLVDTGEVYVCSVVGAK